MSAPQLTCRNCHDGDLEILPGDVHDLVILCQTCGFARGVAREHLLAS